MKKFLALAGLSALILSFLVIPQTSNAFGGKMGRGNGENYNSVHHEAIIKVLENKDYEGWKALVSEKTNTKHRILEIVTKDNFAQFAEAKLLMNKGRGKLNDLGISRGFWKTNQNSQ